MFQLLCFGKLKEPHYRAAAAEYTKRLQGLCRLSVRELEPAYLPQNPSDKEIRAALDKEGALLLRAVPAGATLCALCVEGAALPTEEFANRVQEFDTRGTLVFAIGSSHGLSDAVKQAAAWRLSLSPMTFPHELAQVVLLEQIYRAQMLAAGRSYHK
ncbi:MAG: 23S rRNA (pseudouridine(1915)-N(3))-methyltransferase RlmH [Oscillospiraceae bacterium]|jgi:23S rRNA (pseudouridine1915-N3)-methyltransferase|nr:23S rRNA (pseudouridine(1915)-N(3))-methyltransferase RlmH [Oscillospiraceae bacterium]